MESMEQLVKLASFGTAGVSVLAIFWIGFNIYRLSDDAPAWKATLLSKFMNVCLIIAVISALSGVVNAYFNQNKVQTATENLDIVMSEYDSLSSSFSNYKNVVDQQLSTIKTNVRRNPMIFSDSQNAIQTLESASGDLEISTSADLKKELKPIGKLRSRIPE